MTREEAIDLLDNLNGMIEDSRNSDYDTAFKMAIKALEHEPKTGHWIDTDEGFSPCECSECKLVEFKKSKYCPNCGARMVGDKE